jgi:hypothetical protein
MASRTAHRDGTYGTRAMTMGLFAGPTVLAPVLAHQYHLGVVGTLMTVLVGGGGGRSFNERTFTRPTRIHHRCSIAISGNRHGYWC